MIMLFLRRPNHVLCLLDTFLLMTYPILAVKGFTATGTRTIQDDDEPVRRVLKKVIAVQNVDRDLKTDHHQHDHALTPPSANYSAMSVITTKMPRVINIFTDSTITLEAHIKVSTPIPFCQFPNSPCKTTFKERV